MKRAFKWVGLTLLGVVLIAGALLAHTVVREAAVHRVVLCALVPALRARRARSSSPISGFWSRSGFARTTPGSPTRRSRTTTVFSRGSMTISRRCIATMQAPTPDRIAFHTTSSNTSYPIRLAASPGATTTIPSISFFGVQSDLPNLMTQTQQIDDATDAEHYIARLGEFPRKIDQVIEGLKLRESKGIVPPKFAVEKVSDQIKGFLAPGPKGNTLTVSFKEKLDKIPVGQDGRGDARGAPGSRGARRGGKRGPGIQHAGRLSRNAAPEGDAQ